MSVSHLGGGAFVLVSDAQQLGSREQGAAAGWRGGNGALDEWGTN